jgi:hypothetical protein
VCSGRPKLAAPGGGELSVAGFEVLGHLFFEDLLQHRLHALADPGLYVQIHVVLKLLLLCGQVSPFSLPPQPTRHYP